MLLQMQFHVCMNQLNYSNLLIFCVGQAFVHQLIMLPSFTTWPLTVLCSSPLGTCAQALGSELDAEVYAYRSSLFAESTKQTYTTHRNTYLRFCAFMGYPPLPATSRSICQYAAFLARSLNSYSIPSYLNIVGLMHKEFGLDNPLTDDWHLTSLLKGIKRTIGQPPNQKKPITINMLIDIHSGLNLNNSFDSSFWAICLTAFFGLFRKSHLLTTTKTAFDPSKQFTKSDFIFYPWGALVHVRWSKTIQFRERTVHLPLPRIPHSVLCPVTAILHAFSFTQSGASSSQAFAWLHHNNMRLMPFTYKSFLSKLRLILSSLGYKEKCFATHSFRRGGASFAFQAGIPLELIKLLGDWKSNAVLLYLTVPMNIRLHSVNLIAKQVLSR